VSDPAGIFTLLAKEMANPDTHGSLGIFGAIAEFMRDFDEAAHLGRGDECLSATTGRGGIRIVRVAQMRAVASRLPLAEAGIIASHFVCLIISVP
jgi:hypothetical protein